MIPTTFSGKLLVCNWLHLILLHGSHLLHQELSFLCWVVFCKPTGMVTGKDVFLLYTGYYVFANQQFCIGFPFFLATTTMCEHHSTDCTCSTNGTGSMMHFQHQHQDSCFQWCRIGMGMCCMRDSIGFEVDVSCCFYWWEWTSCVKGIGCKVFNDVSF